MKDAELDLLVLQYLRRKGYHGTAAALQRDSKLGDSGDAVLATQAEQRPVTLENLVHIAETEGSAERYPAAYQKFCTWVDGALDMYRAELKRLLYPVFVRAYIKLIQMSRQQLAAELLNKHKNRLVNSAPPSFVQHREMELRELESVAVPQHLEANPRVKALRARKPTLRLCSQAYHLLVNFLQGAHLWLILNILNEHLDLQVYAGAPSATDNAAVEEEEAEGDPAMLETNRSEVQLQLLKGNLEDKLWELVHPEGEEKEKEKEKDGGEAAKTKKQKVDDKAKAKQRQQHRREVEGRMEAQLKLQELTEEQATAALAEMRNRQDVGASAPPSCCFFTFCNTHQTLTASAHTSDASLLAGGFSDASVRLFSVEAMAAPKDASPGRDGGSAAAPDDGRRRWRERITLHGHSGAVNAVDFTEDTRMLFSASSDGTVRLWSTELGANLVVWRGHVLPVWDVAACPAGYLLASASADRTAHLWCTEHLAPQRIFVGHEADVDAVRWHPNCHYIATGSTDKTVRLWDVQTGACVRLLQGHGSPLTALAFSPDGTSLASAAADGEVMVWDLGSARRTATLRSHNGPVWALAYSQGRGAVLASGGSDETVKFWSSPAAGASERGADKAAGRGSASGAGWEMLSSYRTKNTPVYSLKFSTRNLLLGSGAFTLRSARKP